MANSTNNPAAAPVANTAATTNTGAAPEQNAPTPAAAPAAKKIKKGKFKGHKAVNIRLPLTRTEKDDVWICINGKPLLIKRGVDVEVPECAVEVLQHQEDMLRVSMEYEATASNKAQDDELN